jgi:predicted CopG family antitoxin
MTIKVERETYKKLQLIKMGDEKLRNMTDVIEKLIADSEGVTHASKA